MGTVYLPNKNLIIRLYKLFHLSVSVLLFFVFWLTIRYESFGSILSSKGLRYDLYIALIFTLTVVFFYRTYNAFLLGYSRIRTLALFQFLSQSFSLFVIFLLAIAWLKIENPYSLLMLAVCYAVFDLIWSYSANWLFYKLNPPKRSILVYGNKLGKSSNLDFSGKPVERLYSIKNQVYCNPDNIVEVMKIISGYEAFFALDIPSDCVSRLAQFGTEKNILGFFIPNTGDVIFRCAHHIQSFHEPVLAVSRKIPEAEYLLVKRMFDILASALGIIILSPLMLITATAIRASDGGPAIYRQTRLTTGGKEFTLYKFRTMRVDAEKSGGAVLSNGTEDKRVTAIGRILRAIRFDELPQLFNILRGDMTIVGPRPERPEIAEQYYKSLPEFRLRLQVKAGLTGYAQVYGKYNTSPEQKLKFDLMYINSMGVLTDIRIIFATLGILFMSESTEGVAAGRTGAVYRENDAELTENKT